MDRIFWVLPGRLAGRSGPDSEPWDPADLRAAGIGAVLSVNHAQSCDPEAFIAADIEHACIPLSSNAPPERGDASRCVGALPRAYDFAASAIRRDRPVLVHCTFGNDRTGLFVAYYLMRANGLDPGRAMSRVCAVRPGAFTAQGWDGLARKVLERVEAREAA